MHPNESTVRRLWDAIARGDAAAIRAELSEKPVWEMPGASPLAGTYVGVEAVFHFLARVGELTDDLRATMIEIFTSERGAVVHYSVQAVRGAASLETEHLMLLRIVEGRVAVVQFAPFDQLRYDRFFTRS